MDKIEMFFLVLFIFIMALPIVVTIIAVVVTRKNGLRLKDIGWGPEDFFMGGPHYHHHNIHVDVHEYHDYFAESMNHSHHDNS